MEWWMNPDRAAFAETAKKYAAFLDDWGKTKIQPPLEEQVLRMTPAEFRWELFSEAGRAGLLAAALSENLGGVGLAPRFRQCAHAVLDVAQKPIRPAVGGQRAGLRQVFFGVVELAEADLRLPQIVE